MRARDLCSSSETVHAPCPISQPLAWAPCLCGAAFRVCVGPLQPPAVVRSQLSPTFCQHPESSLPLLFIGTKVMAETGRHHVMIGPPSGSPERALGPTPYIATLDVSGDKESSPFPSLHFARSTTPLSCPGFQNPPEHRLLGKTSGNSWPVFVTTVAKE